MTMPYRQLTQGQRYQIEAGLIAGKNQVSLAKQLGVHPETISREIRRNSTENRYAAVSATQKSDARRAQAHKYCKPCAWFRHYLPIWLQHGMSPEQIAHRLKQERPDDTASHEWIYQFIAIDKRRGGDLYTHLRHRRKCLPKVLRKPRPTRTITK